jgi:hypothetical protein
LAQRCGRGPFTLIIPCVGPACSIRGVPRVLHNGPAAITSDGGRNKAEQDAIAVIDEMLAAYDRVLKQLPALIRRARMHEV